MENRINIIFIGTSDFGIPSLHKLLSDDKFAINAVITQPDKKAGRQQRLTPPPVKTTAQGYGLTIWQPEKISEIEDKISTIRPDIIVVAAYAQLIPRSILDIPRHGIINIHGSLLPYCRGSACVQYPLLKGDRTTGVTIIKMDENFDTGPILAQKEIQINASDTAGTLHKKLSQLGARLLLPTIKGYIAGKITPQPQDHSRANYVNQLKKLDGKIDWNKTAQDTERFIRAMTPWPGAFAYTDDRQQITDSSKIIKILSVEHRPIQVNKYRPGAIFEYQKKLAVQCGQDSLLINQIQPADKKPLTGEEFICGYKNLLNKKLE